MAPPIILAGDIGGTNTRLALFSMEGRRLRRLAEKIFPSGDYRGLDEILRVFLRGRSRVDSACLAVAGPLIGKKIKATNLPWVIDAGSLGRKFPIERLKVINDLVANAWGLPVLKRRDFEVLNRGTKREGNRALLSAGTGLGQAILIWNGTSYIPSPSEGGHVEFGPRNELEVELHRYLTARFGRVSYERILSGQGIFDLYRFLRDSKRFGTEPKWLSGRIETEDPAMVISEAAQKRENRLCTKTLDLFASIYGAAAGNLALQVMALGGVYLGGGIAPKLIWKLRDGTFLKAFAAKGRLSEMVAQIPVKVIMNDRAALLGAAIHASKL